METTKSLVALRTRAELKAGKAPGPGGSLGKLATSVIAAPVPRRGARDRRARQSGVEPADQQHAGDLQQQMISSFSAGIAGGTDEIQRNIIGDRVLGLPRDISVDTKVPFKDLKVGTQRSYAGRGQSTSPAGSRELHSGRPGETSNDRRARAAPTTRPAARRAIAPPAPPSMTTRSARRGPRSTRRAMPPGFPLGTSVPPVGDLRLQPRAQRRDRPAPCPVRTTVGDCARCARCRARPAFRPATAISRAAALNATPDSQRASGATVSTTLATSSTNSFAAHLAEPHELAGPEHEQRRIVGRIGRPGQHQLASLGDDASRQRRSATRPPGARTGWRGRPSANQPRTTCAAVGTDRQRAAARSPPCASATRIRARCPSGITNAPAGSSMPSIGTSAIGRSVNTSRRSNAIATGNDDSLATSITVMPPPSAQE